MCTTTMASKFRNVKTIRILVFFVLVFDRYVWTTLVKRTNANVVPGCQVLKDENYEALRGHRIAVLTNPSAVFPESLRHLVDVLHEETNLDIVGILAPEHGFRGDKQAESGDADHYVDSITGLSVFSVYRKSPEAISRILEEVSATLVLVDMQDIGIRLYTFVWTMYDVLNATNLPTIVLDRPNPLGGALVEGPLLNTTCCTSRYGRSSVAHRHGMTIGELALMFDAEISNQKRHRPRRVSVVGMKGWKRSFSWRETGLPFINPSPNIPTPSAALHYSATVFLEATTISEGRGTTAPFSSFGAPWLSNVSVDFVSALNANRATCSRELGNCFRSQYYIPTFQKYNSTVVAGAQWIDRRDSASTMPTFATAAQILLLTMRFSGSNFSWDGSWFGQPGSILIDRYAGTPKFRTRLNEWSKNSSKSGVDAVNFFEPDVVSFQNRRKPYLLY